MPAEDGPSKAMARGRNDRASKLLDIPSMEAASGRRGEWIGGRFYWDCAMSSDALSDVLETVRMTGAVFFRVYGKKPWAAEQLSRDAVLPMIMPGAEHLISYHIVTEGSCYATVIGGDSIELRAGQVVVFTRGDEHVMSSGPGMRADPVPASTIAEIAVASLPFSASYGDAGPCTAKLVCGFLACDARPFNPLLENLPPVIVADSSDSGGMPWLAELIRLAIAESESQRTGGETVLARLTELMFIEVVRKYVDGLPAGSANWLAGLRDPFVSRALSLMHSDPGWDWTLPRLAKAVGLSRSDFAERFTSFVGSPPMNYLAKWRMQVAAGLLRGQVNIATVASRVGYGSEASFSRAFKKIVGMPPSLWRQR